MKEEKKNKKRKISRILLWIFVWIPLIIIGGFILLCCGIILWERFFNIPAEPKIKHGEFPYELVYKYNGKEYTIKDSIICDYDGIDYAFDGGNFRVWNCDYKENKDDGKYYIDKENNPKLFIYVPYNKYYYMGDEEEDYSGEPYAELDYLPGEVETQTIEDFDIEIVKWNPSEPIKNSYE